MTVKNIGIIAGNGSFPLLSAKEAKAEGYRVIVCAVKGETNPEIEQYASAMCWVKLGQVKKLVHFFKEHFVDQCLMAGKITKTNLFKGEVFPDLDMVKIIATLPDRKDDTLLGCVCQYVEDQGIQVLDSTRFLKGSLAEEGVLSKKKPTKAQLEDIQFGWQLAKEMGRLDVGQSVILKNKAVLAVEAIEGTDEAIQRGGDLGGKGVVVVKVAKPAQDMRFDVPVVGENTVNALVRAKASVLAVEADKTLLIDKEVFLKRVNEANIVFVAKKQIL